MKERLLMGFIGFVIILILSWAVMAVASSYNSVAPIKTEVVVTENKIDLTTHDAEVDMSRTGHKLPDDTRTAPTNR
jgi:hypothetical protein